MNFLFAYGSLMHPESAARTGRLGKGKVVTISGLSRAWNHPVPNEPRTGLGAVFREGSTCNGVLFSVDKGELSKFDEREQDYKRVSFPSSFIPAHGPVWVYIPETVKKPTRQKPIAQTYVDTVLAGCLLHGEELARDLIRTTLGWDGVWVDDRKTPLYPRQPATPPDTARIDALLKEIVPSAFGRRISASRRLGKL